MVFRFLVCWVFLLNTVCLSAQTLKGKVVDEKTGQPLAYVNIGIVHARLGTTSLLDGTFELDTDQSIAADAVLRFSMVGYTAREFRWKDIQQEKNWSVSLQPTAVEIDEIVVVSCQTKKLRKIGKRIKRMPMSFISFSSEELGAEIVSKITIEDNQETHLTQLWFWMEAAIKDTVFFRVNVYADEGGQPGKELLKENILTATAIGKGEVAVDLQPYHLKFKENIFIGIEYIHPTGKRTTGSLYFAGRLRKPQSYCRYTSQSEWTKIPLINFGFAVEVCQP